MNAQAFNPYAAPRAEFRIPSRAVSLLMTASTTACALCVACIILAGGSAWHAAAVVFGSLTLHLCVGAAVAFLVNRSDHEEDAAPLDHRKVRLPSPRRAPLGEAYAERGSAVVEIMAVLAAVPLIVLLIIAIMGATEPRW